MDFLKTLMISSAGLKVQTGRMRIIAENVETLNLAEAAAHPDFAYRPETGEEKYHSFAGVPIVI